MSNMGASGSRAEFWQRCLPRNLSYVEESFLDAFSVSGNFTHNSRRYKELAKYTAEIARKTNGENMTECSVEFDVDAMPCDSPLTLEKPSFEKQQSCTDSEEGVFLNMMDDLESLESDTCSGRSMCSDDSINSPDENLDDESDLQNNGSVLLSKAVSAAMIRSVSKQTSPPLADFLKLDLNDSGLPDHNTSSDSTFNYDPNDSPIYEDSEFNFERKELRKSTSLKTNKTPPGTPRRKKMVRFADALGLDLESVRHILNLESPPKIPASAMADLRAGIEHDRKSQGHIYLSPTFPQPGASHTFTQLVKNNNLCLENAVVTNLTITGVVRVANIGFHKMVRIRYTINNWVSFYDIGASYIQDSCDGPTDRFSFSIVAPKEFGVGSKLEFAVSYTVSDQTFWDGNYGHNYVFECYAKAIPTEVDAAWMHFI